MLFKVTNRKNDGFIRAILEWVFTLIIAIFISLFIVSNIITVTQIKEQSMEPTFKSNDRVILYKLGYHLGAPKRGDLIVLNKQSSEKGFLLNMINEGKDIMDNISYRLTGIIEKNNLIKRVVAVAGDVLDIKDGKVYINNIEEEDYYFVGNTYENSNFSYPIEIPENKVFVLGDNRENSLDSRNLGLIDSKQIKGKVTFRIWPINSFGTIK